MAIESFEEVQQYINDNMDKDEKIKNYVGSFINPDRVNNFLNTEDGKKLLQPTLDAYHSKGLKSWQDKNISKLVDEEVKKRFPDADPKDIAINEMKAELAKWKASKIMQEKKLPMELMDYFIADSEPNTIANITKFETVLNTIIDAKVQERIKDNNYTPPAGGGTPKAVTQDMFAKMGYAERVKLAAEQPELYKELTKK